MINAYKRLAEDHGARFRMGNESDRWTVEDKDGITIVSDAMSIAEAARLYCEDKGLTSSEEILDRIVAAYRPYRVLAEFWHGFVAGQGDSVLRRNPYQDAKGVKAQAWDRGVSVAMQYLQALAQKTSAQAEADEAPPAWMVRLLRQGRR